MMGCLLPAGSPASFRREPLGYIEQYIDSWTPRQNRRLITSLSITSVLKWAWNCRVFFFFLPLLLQPKAISFSRFPDFYSPQSTDSYSCDDAAGCCDDLNESIQTRAARVSRNDGRMGPDNVVNKRWARGGFEEWEKRKAGRNQSLVGSRSPGSRNPPAKLTG
jgi:hypothetical protein